MIFEKKANNLVNTTVKICCTLSTGELVDGTGFFCELEVTDEEITIVIVTNKHVIQDAIHGEIDFPILINGKEDFDTINIDDFENHWIKHPENNIDLCILPIANYIDFEQYEKDKKLLDISLIHLDYFPNSDDLEELSDIENVIMIGYPNGIMDYANIKPIVRKGITATSLNVDYDDNPEFLIDIACFEGSSGSPVLIYDEGVFIGKDGHPRLGIKLFFLGVLYAGYDKSEEGELVKTKVKNLKIKSLKIPLNLGIVIKANKLLDFIEILKRE